MGAARLYPTYLQEVFSVLRDGLWYGKVNHRYQTALAHRYLHYEVIKEADEHYPLGAIEDIDIIRGELRKPEWTTGKIGT